MIKRVFGFIFFALGIIFVFSKPYITGNIINSNVNAGLNISALVLLIASLVLFYAEGKDLEERLQESAPEKKVKKRGKIAESMRKLGVYVVAGAVGLGGGSYGAKTAYHGTTHGRRVHNFLETTARDAEKTYQTAQIFTDILPGESYDSAALRYYARGVPVKEDGTQYVTNRQKGEEWIERVEEATKVLFETSERKAGELTDNIPGLRGYRNVRSKVGEAIGKGLGIKDTDKMSLDKYRKNRNEIARQRLKALRNLRQVNATIGQLTTELTKKRANPKDNPEAMQYMDELMQKANILYEFIDESDFSRLKPEQVYKGSEDPVYKDLHQIGKRIAEPDYPLTRKLMGIAESIVAGVGAAAGAVALTRRRSRRAIGSVLDVGERVVERGARSVAPYARKGAYYAGRATRETGRQAARVARNLNAAARARIRKRR